MATRHTGSAPALPLDLIAQAVPRLTRHDLEILTERLIDALDLIDGDSDLEDSGDELDGSGAEDDFATHPSYLDGPGCPIADPDFACDDVRCDDEEEYGDQFCDPEAKAVQRKRIQRTRCVAKYVWRSSGTKKEREGFRLYYEPTVPTKRSLFSRKRGVPRRPRG